MAEDENSTVSDVNVWIGAETGLLKSVDLVKKVATNHYAHFGKNHEISTMCWDDSSSNVLYTGHLNGKIRKYELDINSYSDCHDIPDYNDKLEKLVSIYKTEEQFISCTTKGHLKLWTIDNKEKDLIDINLGVHIKCTAFQPANSLLASGGLENCLKIWDLNSPGKVVFRSKNVKPDWLQLRVPINDTNIEFVPNSGQIVTTTGTHNIRLYDPKAPSRRPVAETSFADHPITALATCERDNSYIFVGNTRGIAARYDLRNLKRMVRGYKGFAGSIRSIKVHKTQPYVFFCGLDRHLCVHDEKFATPKFKVYLKSRLNCLLVSDANVDEDKIFSAEKQADKREQRKRKLSETDDDNDDSSDDEMWSKMNKVNDENSDSNDSDEDS